MATDVRVLSLWQPWASLIMLGIKTIETRGYGWPSTVPLPARILIHASKRKPDCAIVDDWSVTTGPWWHRGEMAVNTEWLLWSEESGEPVGHPLPLGAVLGWVTVTDSLPMVEDADDVPDTPAVIENICGHTLRYWPEGSAETEEAVSVSDQLPYGDFTPGRFGWLLADPAPFAEPISKYPCGRCKPDWQGRSSLSSPITRCPICQGRMSVPVKGARGLWRPDAALAASLPVEDTQP